MKYFLGSKLMCQVRVDEIPERHSNNCEESFVATFFNGEFDERYFSGIDLDGLVDIAIQVDVHCQQVHLPAITTWLRGSLPLFLKSDL